MKVAITTSILSFGALCAAGQKSSRPNILYIMTDDHSEQTISAYDGRFNSTPGLDRLAASGVRFENSFVANSLSGPSRACLLTGKHSHANGFLDNESDAFNGAQQTFPKLLQAAGYTTAIIGKWHLESTPTGFDYWEILPGQGSYYNPDFITAAGTKQYQGYATDITTDKAIEWIEAHKDDSKPFCMLLHYKAVHRNWMSDSAHMKMYEKDEFEIPETFYDNYNGRLAAAAQDMNIARSMDLAYDNKIIDESINTRHKGGYIGGELARMNESQRSIFTAHYDSVKADFLQRNLSGDALTEWKYQRYMKDYLKCVASLDDNIARTLDYMADAGMLENTIIVYASDQGFYMGEHGWFDKRFMYEQSMHTPLIVRMPDSYVDAPRGVTNSHLVQNIDYAPTFLELAGVAVPSDIHGQSLLPLLKGEKPEKWRADGLYYHYYEYPGEHQVRRHEGVRTERYKLMHFYGHDIDCWELYDLHSDKNELHNLYGSSDYASIQKELTEKLTRLKTKYGVK